MKNIHKVIVIIFILFAAKANAQNWMWSKQIGGASDEGCGNTCIDNAGNLFINGTYDSNPCYFSKDTIQTLNGYNDFFIAKYDASGNEIWQKHFGGYNTQMQPDGISKMSYNSLTNSIFIAGPFAGTCTFGSFTLSAAQSDAYIARIDSDGNVLWAKKVGSGAGIDNCRAMTTDDNGNVYAEILLASSGSIDTVGPLSGGVYFAKFDSSGNLLWVSNKKFNTNGSPGFDVYYTDMKIIGSKIFCIGVCRIDSIVIDTVPVYLNVPSGQPIVSCYDVNFNALWVKPCGGHASVEWFAITGDEDKHVYITGSFSQTAFFGNDTLHVVTPGSVDMFIAKYDSLGNYLWVRQASASVNATGNGLAMGGDGDVYLTGFFSGSATFGSNTFNSTANGDMMIVRYGQSGGVIGIRHLGYAVGSGVAIDNNDDVYTTGGFWNGVNFGSNPTLTSYGNSDIFIAKSAAITGIGGLQRNANNELIIYANPTKGTCNVTIPDEFIHEKNLTLQIYDNTGKLLQQTKVEMQQDKIKLNLQQEAKGVYNVVLSSKRKSYNGKVVFE